MEGLRIDDPMSGTRFAPSAAESRNGHTRRVSADAEEAFGFAQAPATQAPMSSSEYA